MNNDIKKHLSAADLLLSKIFVNEDSVFLMANARQELKAAFDLLKQEEKDDG